MALDLIDCTFTGPALPEPFVKFDLEQQLGRVDLLPKATGEEGKRLQASWEIYQRKLRELVGAGGDRRVFNHVLEPLVERLGYVAASRQEPVATREGAEDGGWLLVMGDGNHRLRVWSVAAGTDLDAPSRRGHAYRFSPTRIAQRVLLASNERIGLLTDGDELRLLLCDPARPDSQIMIRLDRTGGWRGRRQVPELLSAVFGVGLAAGRRQAAPDHRGRAPRPDARHQGATHPGTDRH